MRQMHAWDEVYTAEESKLIIRDLALLHCQEIPGEFGDKLRAAVMLGDVSFLCGCAPPYDGSLTVSALIEARQVLAFYQKSEWLRIPGVDPELAAWEKYKAAEIRCRETNDCLSAWARGGFQFPPRVESVLHSAQRKIAQVLGPFPSIDTLVPRLGPGATTSIKKTEASWKRKFASPLTCSETFAPFVAEMLEQMPHFLDLHATWEEDPSLDGELRGRLPVQLTACKLSFVHKKPGIKRAVTPQPMLNSMYQLGVGDYMTARCRRFGLDLTDQSRNQRLAREGSLTGEIATLDLVSASDTLASKLVWHLFPFEWAEKLDRACQRRVTYKGCEVQEEKFAGMGNGFTFPVESLIFWALATSCDSSDKVSVYGDDITCHVSAVPLLIEVLDACGFWVNQEKSYWRGNFRESCGKDYFSGIDIRPYYQKHLVGAESLFTLHNFYVRHLREEMAEYVRRTYLCKDLQIFGPDGYGDGHLLGDWHPKSHGRGNGWSGFLFDTFTWKGRRDFKPSPADHVLPLYSIYLRDNLVSPHEIRWDDTPVVREGTSLLAPTKAWIPSHEEESPVFSKSETRLGVSLPGKRGYKRISIYTLRPGD